MAIGQKAAFCTAANSCRITQGPAAGCALGFGFSIFGWVPTAERSTRHFWCSAPDRMRGCVCHKRQREARTGHAFIPIHGRCGWLDDADRDILDLRRHAWALVQEGHDGRPDRPLQHEAQIGGDPDTAGLAALTLCSRRSDYVPQTKGAIAAARSFGTRPATKSISTPWTWRGFCFCGGCRFGIGRWSLCCAPH